MLTKSRVETFSDGIFAIIVTLLILEIRVPHLDRPDSSAQLFQAIALMLPKFISWVISFVTICIVWVNHHRLFESFKGIDLGLFWLNVHLLLWICFIPFPTALMGDYPHNKVSVALYGLVMSMIGLAFYAARSYGLRHREILKESIQLKAYKRSVRYALLFGFLSYIIGAGLAWVNTYLSFAVYVIIAVYFIFAFGVHRNEAQ